MKGYSLARALLPSVAVAACGWRAGALTPRGSIAATLVGSTVIAGTSWRGAALLGLFFATGSVLSKVGRQADFVEKGGRRDERQVLANGGVAGLAAASVPFLGEYQSFALLAGSLAAATSDTWATEIGSTSSKRPRMIISGKRIPSGLSGGVTARGTLASLAGAAAIGALTAVLVAPQVGPSRAAGLGVATTLGGVSGSLLDSLLGEVLQSKRWSPAFKVQVETDEYRGETTVPVSGLTWFDNDLVNGCCTLAGALISGLAWSQIVAGEGSE